MSATQRPWRGARWRCRRRAAARLRPRLAVGRDQPPRDLGPRRLRLAGADAALRLVALQFVELIAIDARAHAPPRRPPPARAQAARSTARIAAAVRSAMIIQSSNSAQSPLTGPI